MANMTPGSTGATTYFMLRDTTTGDAKVGLLYNSPGAKAYYTRPREAAAIITLATQTPTGAWSDGGFVEVDGTNAPGLYRLDLPDAALAVSPNEPYVLVTIGFDNTLIETKEIGLGAEVNVTQINGNLVAAIALALSAQTIIYGEAIAGTLSTTQMSTNLTETVDNKYVGRVVGWVSGALAGEYGEITGYNGTTKVLTYTTRTSAPSISDPFVIG